jgi:hypothetical protein
VSPHPDPRIDACIARAVPFAQPILRCLRKLVHRAVVKLPPGEVAALVRSGPKAFATNAWSKQGWMEVRLAQVNEAQLRELLEIAWRGVAPGKLAAARDSG